MADPSGGWDVDGARTLSNGVYYRFTLLAPGNLTADSVSAFLESKGWSVKAIEGALASVAATIPLPATPFAVAPVAWTVHATWTGAASVLPISDEQLIYGQLDVFVPAGRPPTNWKMIGLVSAALFGGIWLWGEWEKRKAAPAFSY